MVLTDDYASDRFFAPAYRVGWTDTIVDLGAHIGAFAIAASHAVPRGRVHAVEPGRETFSLLQRNVVVNQCANVAVHRLAITDASGTAALHRGTDSWGDSLWGRAANDEPPEKVAMLSLHDFLDAQRIGRVDYLKVNVEGAEYAILHGTPIATLRRIGCMIVEYHCIPEQDPAALVARLRGCGFQVSRRPTDDEPGKGWLIATC